MQRSQSSARARRLLALDFSAAFVASVAYFVLFGWLQTVLALPRWLATLQLAANLGYGLFGASIFFLRYLAAALLAVESAFIFVLAWVELGA